MRLVYITSIFFSSGRSLYIQKSIFTAGRSFHEGFVCVCLFITWICIVDVPFLWNVEIQLYKRSGFAMHWNNPGVRDSVSEWNKFDAFYHDRGKTGFSVHARCVCGGGEGQCLFSCCNFKCYILSPSNLHPTNTLLLRKLLILYDVIIPN